MINRILKRHIKRASQTNTVISKMLGESFGAAVNIRDIEKFLEQELDIFKKEPPKHKILARDSELIEIDLEASRYRNAILKYPSKYIFTAKGQIKYDKIYRLLIDIIQKGGGVPASQAKIKAWWFDNIKFREAFTQLLESFIQTTFIEKAFDMNWPGTNIDIRDSNILITDLALHQKNYSQSQISFGSPIQNTWKQMIPVLIITTDNQKVLFDVKPSTSSFEITESVIFDIGLDDVFFEDYEPYWDLVEYDYDYD